MANLNITGNNDDFTRHHVLMKEITINYKKSSKIPNDIHVTLNGYDVPATFVNTKSNAERVQQWVLHDEIDIFFNMGDTLIIRTNYERHWTKFRKGAQENFQLNEFDIDEQHVAVLCGEHSTVSLAFRAGDFNDITAQLDPLRTAQTSNFASGSFSQFASSLSNELNRVFSNEIVQGAFDAAIDTIGQTHPLAKVVVVALSIPYKMLKMNIEFNENLANLAKAMLATCRCLADARSSTNIASAKETFVSILETLRDAALYLKKYEIKKRLQQIVEAQFSQKLGEYAKTLITQKNEFQMAMVIQIARDVDVVSSLTVDGFLRKRLDPSDVSVEGNRCMEGTRVRILDEALNWVKNRESEHSILWINGAPGAGKSTIATTLVARLDKSEHACVRFFCKRDIEELRNPRRVWRTVAYQLSDVDVGMKSALMSTVNKKENKWIKNEPPLDQFRELIEDVLSVVGTEAKLYSSKRIFVIVIDALDECVTPVDDRSSWRSLLSSLVEWRNPMTRELCKVIVTGRRLTDIENQLNNASDQITLGTGADVSEEGSDDIKKFFIANFAEIRKEFSITQDWPDAAAINDLTDYAGGLFIWAETAVKFVGQRSVGLDPKKRLEEILSDIQHVGSEATHWRRMRAHDGGLDRLYGRIIYDAFLHSSVKERLDANRAIATVALAMEPIRMCDLIELFSTDDPISREAIESTLRELRPIITVSSNGELRACHKTVSDFFLSYENSKEAIRFFVKDGSEEELESYVVKGGEEHALVCAFYACSIFSKDVKDIVKYFVNRDCRTLDYAVPYWDSHLDRSKGGFSSLSKAMGIGYRCLKHSAPISLSVEAEATGLIQRLRDCFNLVVPHLKGVEDADRDKVESMTLELDAARGEFQVSGVLRRNKSAIDADKFLRNRLQPANPSELDSECLEGTRRDVIESVNKWLTDSTQKNVLWINGPPGAGKSTLATTLHKQISRVRNCVKVDAKRDISDRRNPRSIWRTIAYQLADLNVGLKGSIMQAVSAGVQIASVKEQYEFIIKRALEEQQHFSVVIIIDALDECSTEDPNDWEELLQTMSSQPERVKLLVLSRVTSDIEIALGAVSHIISLPTGLDASDEAKADTELYIRGILEVNRPSWLTDALMQRTISYTAGSFIWAKMFAGLVPRLNSAGDLRAILDGDAFGGNDAMDLLYGKLLVEIMGRLNEKERSICRSVLSTIVLARDPLHKRDLVRLVPILSGISYEAKANELLDQAFSDLSVIVSSDDGQPIRIPHKSFVDFFIDSRRTSTSLRSVQDPRKYLLRYKEDSASIAITCLKVMNSSLKFNICGIESSHTLNENMSESRVSECISTTLIYACRFFAEHLKDGKNMDAELLDHIQPLLKTLLCENFLYWLEVLSATKAVDSAEGLLDATLSFVGDEDLKGVAGDAIKFVRAYEVPITQSISHIYLSALAFCPTESRIYGIYGALYPGVLSYNVTSSPNWLEELLGVDLSSAAAFLNEKEILITLGDRAYICDFKEETLMRSLVSHESLIWSVSISRDGKLVATGDGGGNLRIRESDTGTCRLGSRLSEGGGMIVSIAFSPDGSQVATACHWPGSLDVWDVNDGRRRYLEGHTKPVWCVAFSPNGHFIASGSEDNTTRIWDAKSLGKELQVLTAHTNGVYCLAFSPDGKYLATGAEDRTIRIWNVSQGQALDQSDVIDTGDGVLSLTFSPNSEFLVSGSRHGILSFWNVSSGTCQRVAQYFGNSVDILSVEFSPHGHSLLSISRDRSLKIWAVPWVGPPRFSSVKIGAMEKSELQREHFSLSEGCFIHDDGWMRDPSLGEDTVLFWVPKKNRGGVWWPRNTAVFHKCVTRLDFSRFVHGRDWTKCRDPPSSSAS